MDQRTLLFTDVVDSTKVVQRLGDAAAAALWTEHDRLARALLSEHNGLEIDRSDGFFLLFDDVTAAAGFAIRYHVAVAGLELAARVGIHHGVVTLRENPPEAVARGAKPIEVEGLAKPLAARVMALAAGRQTLVSNDAAAALQPHLPTDLQLRAHGHYRLKGIEEPLALFELGDARCGFAPPSDVDKAYRVVRDNDLWRPLREVRHNLAPERDAFVGRVAELRQLAETLDAGARLVSVLGVGGTGKTRLVRRYARAWLGDWPGGVYFCDLSEARSLEGICFAVASALEVPLGKDDPVVQLGHAIACHGNCLVILDNFEQVHEHATATLGRWIDRAAEAAFIVTSRERLQLPGEASQPVEPLLLDSEAIELFAVRARAQRPDFALIDTTRESIGQIVKLLDGLPLAIELAAARIRVLSPAQIVERLRDRFQVLAGSPRGAARQATLRAAIDWSWQLLQPWEQRALAQCSVFDGGFTLEAAEAVIDLREWPEAPPALDVVQALVDKSLLRSWVAATRQRLAPSEPYFGMYLSIRDYCAEKLAATSATAQRAAHERHGAYYAAFGDRDALASLGGLGGLHRRHALELELDNVVAACRRAALRGDAAVAVPAFRAAWEVLSLCGPFGAGVALGQPVLALPGMSDEEHVRCSIGQADALLRTGRLAEAHALAGKAVQAAQRSGLRRDEGEALTALGLVQREQGHLHDSRVTLELALVVQRELGHALAEATTRQALGLLLDQLGQPGEARSHLEEALAVFGRLGNRHSIGQVHAALGVLNRHQGRLQEAIEHYQRALELLRENGDRRSEGVTMGQLGNVLRDIGRDDEARRLYEAALAVHREVGSRTVEPYALANLGLVHTNAGRHDAARDCFAQALAIDREVGNRFHEGVVLSNLGFAEFEVERLDAAREALLLSIERMREVGNRLYLGTALSILGEVLRCQQQIAPAAAAIDEGEPILREIGSLYQLANLLLVKARLAFGRGELAAARAALAEADELTRRMGTGADCTLSRFVEELRVALA